MPFTRPSGPCAVYLNVTPARELAGMGGGPARALERDGLVTRTVHPTIPPRVEYELTKLGRTLYEPVAAVAEWVRRNRPAIEAARRALDAAEAAKPSHRRVRKRMPALLDAQRRARLEEKSGPSARRAR